MWIPLAIAFSSASRERAGSANLVRKLTLAAFAALALAGFAAPIWFETTQTEQA